MAKKEPERKNEVMVKPDQAALAQADRLAVGIGRLVAQGSGLYRQLIEGKGQLGFNPERLGLILQTDKASGGSEDLARNLVDFRRALRALSSVTEIAGLPIGDMQLRVSVLAAVLKRNELQKSQKSWGEVIIEGGRPKGLDDIRTRGGAVSRQLAIREGVGELDRQIAISPFKPDTALEKVLALPEMEGIFHLAIMFAESMAATKYEFDALLHDLAVREESLTGKALTAGRINGAFHRFEENRIKLAGEVAASQTALAAFDTRATDSQVRRDRMDSAAKEIDVMATKAKAYNDSFMAGVQSMLQMKSLTMGAVTEREMMENYLTGLKYLMTIYYMQAAGLAGCLTGAARITGAAMRQYLEIETQRVLGQVGQSLNLVDAVEDQVTGEMFDLMNAGAILKKPEEPNVVEG